MQLTPQAGRVLIIQGVLVYVNGPRHLSLRVPRQNVVVPGWAEMGKASRSVHGS